MKEYEIEILDAFKSACDIGTRVYNALRRSLFKEGDVLQITVTYKIQKGSGGKIKLVEQKRSSYQTFNGRLFDT